MSNREQAEPKGKRVPETRNLKYSLAAVKEARRQRDEYKQQRDELLAAARLVEAHSYYQETHDEEVGHYVVDAKAMDAICEAIGRAKTNV